ncbi:uncharacterized protein LOC110181306 [Drosophila serrata]|uniref:uncharacterized protein LOC110181306 n=1 Tax=Drosophila serrata TaxID=7274 RepID=UPI000A1D023A|nr:uncharacterized protein LOC110181306 [Drosophila serrata]
MDQIYLVFVVLIWLFNVFSMLVVPFPIKVPKSKLKVKDLSLRERERFQVKDPVHNEGLKPKDKNSYQSDYLNDPEETMSKSNLGLRLFPEFFTANVSESETPQETDKDDDDKNDANVKGDSKGVVSRKKSDDPDPPPSEAAEIGGVQPTTLPTEKTISIPIFKTDYLGHWVYNPWGVTYGHLYRDTRFIGLQYSGPFPELDRHTAIFNPKRLITKKVCRIQSTIYNTPRMMRYLMKPFYHFVHAKQPILTDLRWRIYLRSDSEECHSPTQINWRVFTECMMIRNMRMESNVPYYPLRQTHEDWDYNTEYSGWGLDVDPFLYYDYNALKPRYPDTHKRKTQMPYPLN